MECSVVYFDCILPGGTGRKKSGNVNRQGPKEPKPAKTQAQQSRATVGILSASGF